jgi:hypothetical protein
LSGLAWQHNTRASKMFSRSGTRRRAVAKGDADTPTGDAILIAVFAFLAARGLALQVLGLSGRLRKLEAAREVERRHREHLAVQVEPIQDRKEGVPPTQQSY